MAENTSLRTLDYAGSAPSRWRDWLPFIVAVGLGAAGGIGLAYLTYTPLLRFFAAGMQLSIYNLNDAIYQPIEYRAAVALGGAVAGFSAVAARRWVGRRSYVFWAILFTGISVGTALLRVHDIHAELSEYLRAQIEIGKSFAASQIPATMRVPATITFSPDISLDLIPICTVPIAGSIAVVIVLAVLVAPRLIKRDFRLLIDEG